MIEKEYIIFCDESDKDGTYFTDFYGGLIIGASQYQKINLELENLAKSLNIKDEIKWQKVSEFNLPMYRTFIEHVFNRIKDGSIKTRIMFLKKSNVPRDQSHEYKRDRYYKLYYQFIKHGLRLFDVTPLSESINVRLYVDELAYGTNEQIQKFRNYLSEIDFGRSLSTLGFFNPKIKIKKENIAFVESKKHILLQTLDLILGSMPFWLNEKYKFRNQGKKQIPNRTKAKIELYKQINKSIREIQPNFNIGMSTSVYNKSKEERFNCPHAHWLFVPTESTVDRTLTKGFLKKKKRKTPPFLSEL